MGLAWLLCKLCSLYTYKYIEQWNGYIFLWRSIFYVIYCVTVHNIHYSVLLSPYLECSHCWSSVSAQIQQSPPCCAYNHSCCICQSYAGSMLYLKAAIVSLALRLYHCEIFDQSTWMDVVLTWRLIFMWIRMRNAGLNVKLIQIHGTDEENARCQWLPNYHS